MSDHKQTLLIIDDDQGILYYLKKIFEDRSIAVHTVRGFDEAQTYLATEKPSMILSDLNACGSIDGIEFYLKQLAKTDIPVALHSGSIVPTKSKASSQQHKKYTVTFEKAIEFEDFQILVQEIAEKSVPYALGCFIKPASPDLILKYFQSFIPELTSLVKNTTHVPENIDERRKFERHVFPYLASYRKLGQGTFQFALCHDISIGGACIIVKTSETHISEMELKIPLHHNHQSFILHVFGKAIWSKETEIENVKHLKIGIEFERLTLEDTAFLKNFIELQVSSFAVSSGEENKDHKNTKRNLFIQAVKHFKENPEKSLGLFTELLEADPNHISAIMYKGYLMDRLGYPEEAEIMFKKAQELESHSNS